MISTPKCIVFLLVVQGCTLSRAQDIAETQRTLAGAQEKLTRIRLMLPAYDRDSQNFAKLNEGLASAIQEIERFTDRVDVIETEILQSVQAGFTNLKPCDVISWKVAPRQKAFLTALPEDLEITSKSGSAIIKKVGNPLNLPIAPSPTYHVCPDFALAAGDRALLRISIPGQQLRGSTPVPYFGLRDTEGSEIILGFLIEDDKEHEILIQCLGSDGFAFYDGTMGSPLAVDKLVPPLYIFFHMNDTSELKIHELQLSRIASPD